MSTLTKILVVLLTLSSIFLCGIVVTYTANTEDYKAKYATCKKKLSKSETAEESLSKQLNLSKKEKLNLKNQLNKELTSVSNQLKTIQIKNAELERGKAKLEQQISSWTSVTKNFSSTTSEQQQLLEKTIQEKTNLMNQKVTMQKQLDETSESLLEKLAIIETLESQKKRLVEEKTGLQNKLGKDLFPAGKNTALVTGPVTQLPDTKAGHKQESFEDIKLFGKIIAVDLKNNMASISIGQADGVKTGMKFHVTRADEFICDIEITDVDASRAVGVLQLVQQLPLKNDNVSTNF